MYGITYIKTMRTTTITALRKNLAAEVERVLDDHEALVVTRTGGRGAAVLISIEDYQSLTETDYLLADPANVERLEQGMKAFELRRGRRVDWPE